MSAAGTLSTPSRSGARPRGAAPAAEQGAEGGARPADLQRAFGAVRSVAGLTMASRVLGLSREVLMASLLGAGAVADAFLLAWTLPNLARRLFGEGAFAAALLPVFTESRERGDHAGAERLVSVATTRLTMGLVLFTLLLELGLALLRSEAAQGLYLAWGVDAARLDLPLHLSQVLLPHLVLACVAGVLGGALNAVGRFALPAATPSLLNLAWMGLLLVGAAAGGGDLFLVELLAWGLLGAGVLTTWLHWRATNGAGIALTPSLAGAPPEQLARVRAMFRGLVLGLALFQVNCLCDQLLAWCFAPPGGVSALNYANRLVQLPIGVLGVAISTVIFPQLARLAKRGDLRGAGELVDRGLAVAAFVSFPAALGLAALGQPVVEVLLARGAFDAEAAARTARAMLFLTPAVVAACLTPVLTRAFYAEEETRLPVRISAVCVGLNLGLNLLLVGRLGEAGLALATSVSQLVGLGLLLVCLRRRRVRRGDLPPTRTNLGRAARTALGAVAATALALLAWRLLPAPEPVRLGVAVGASSLLYLGLARLGRWPELGMLLARSAQRPPGSV